MERLSRQRNVRKGGSGRERPLPSKTQRVEKGPSLNTPTPQLIPSDGKLVSFGRSALTCMRARVRFTAARPHPGAHRSFGVSDHTSTGTLRSPYPDVARQAASEG
eukprot:366001-Chlamydomonas_euryale.AAC.15